MSRTMGSLATALLAKSNPAAAPREANAVFRKFLRPSVVSGILLSFVLPSRYGVLLPLLACESKVGRLASQRYVMLVTCFGGHRGVGGAASLGRVRRQALYILTLPPPPRLCKEVT